MGGFLLLLLFSFIILSYLFIFIYLLSVWRPGNGRFDVDDLDPQLCTHFVFGFAVFTNVTWEIEVSRIIIRSLTICVGCMGGQFVYF